MLLCDLWYGVKQALEQRSDNKLMLKSRCENPSCRPDDEHLATISTCHPGYFVCDRRKEKYSSTCMNREALEAGKAFLFIFVKDLWQLSFSYELS